MPFDHQYAPALGAAAVRPTTAIILHMWYLGFPSQPQILQNPANARPSPAKENQRKKAWISLDSLGGN
jgi:hypothetical protein